MARKWITFDLDGTLMQNPFVEWVFPEINWIVKKETGFEGNVAQMMISEHRRRMRENLIVEAYDWDAILKEMLRDNNLDMTIDIVTLVKKHSIIPKVYLLEEGMLVTLQLLKTKGYSLAAVTNGYSIYQLPVMETLGLNHVFDALLAPDNTGFAKPNIRMVDQLRNKDNKIAAHVGDRIDHDVVFANKLGVVSVMMYRNMLKSLMEIDPLNRNQSESFQKYCISKWQKETGLGSADYSLNIVPAVVVDSVREMVY